MITITPTLDFESKRPLYLQLYNYVKNEIYRGRLAAGDKLPSLRSLAASLQISITTIELAYNQLSVEGYIVSREKSGYFVNENVTGEFMTRPQNYQAPVFIDLTPHKMENTRQYADSALFDFVKWKKCLNHVINEYSDQLAYEASPQGELYLRNQISHYLYMTRGVVCTPDQIIIAAGTQQIINLACSFLSVMKLDNIAYEDPGYISSINVFKDRGFNTIPISISETGASLEEIIASAPSVVCVSPSIQFPMGIVMPIGRRQSLLKYAAETNCIIIEDDYASELRYFGRPVPPIKSIDKNADVLYLGSFSSVLFPSLKISYMVLPDIMMPYSEDVMSNYNQTCSKTEQLALATYMDKGLLHTHIKKLRNLYANKITLTNNTITEVFGNKITVFGKESGLNMVLKIDSDKSAAELCSLAKEIGISMVPLEKYSSKLKDEDKCTLIFYYSNIPSDKIKPALKELSEVWKL